MGIVVFTRGEQEEDREREGEREERQDVLERLMRPGDESRIARSMSNPERFSSKLADRPGGAGLLVLAALAAGCGGTEGVPRSESIVLHAHPGDCRQCHGDIPPGGPRSAPPPKTCAAPACHRVLDPTPRLVHGPVATGDCLICHLPHSSVASHLVAAPAPRLCAGCHDRLYTCPAVSAPNSDCLTCHEPHGGARNFLRPAGANGPAAQLGGR